MVLGTLIGHTIALAYFEGKRLSQSIWYSLLIAFITFLAAYMFMDNLLLFVVAVLGVPYLLYRFMIKVRNPEQLYFISIGIGLVAEVIIELILFKTVLSISPASVLAVVGVSLG